MGKPDGFVGVAVTVEGDDALQLLVVKRLHVPLSVRLAHASPPAYRSPPNTEISLRAALMKTRAGPPRHSCAPPPPRVSCISLFGGSLSLRDDHRRLALGHSIAEATAISAGELDRRGGQARRSGD